MSFATELAKATSDKLALVEFDIGREWNEYATVDGGYVAWVNYEPGIYYTRFDGVYPDVDSYWLDQTIATAAVTTVGGVTYDGTNRLSQKTSVASMFTEPSFYYDRSDETLYVHMPTGNSPATYNIRIGIATQVATKHYIDELQGNQYDADLMSVPSVKKSIDPLFFGRISFDDASFALDNHNGTYDFLTTQDVFGQTVRFYLGFSSLAFTDFLNVWTGYLDDVTIGEDALQIRASDPRRALQTPLPPNRFDSTTYPDIDDRDVGEPIPLAYGEISRVVPTCVNKSVYAKDTAQDLTFKLADMTNYSAIHEITTVYHKGEALTTSSGDDIYLKSTDLTTAEFVLNKAADVELDFKEVEVTFQGYEDGSGALIDNGLDIIKELIVNHTDALYNTSWFDTTTWASVQSEVDNVYLWVDDEEDLIKLIESIARSIRVQFDTTGAGLYTARIYESFKTPDTKVHGDELLEPLELEYSADEWISRATVEYANGKKYVDTSEESTVKERFKQARNRTFETVLVDDADAQSFATEAINLQKELRPLVPVTTKTQITGLAVEDHVYIEMNRRAADWLGWTRCRVESIDYNYNTFTATVGARVLATQLVEGGVDGGTATGTGAITIDGGTATEDYTEVLDGGNASFEYVAI